VPVKFKSSYLKGNSQFQRLEDMSKQGNLKFAKKTKKQYQQQNH